MHPFFFVTFTEKIVPKDKKHLNLIGSEVMLYLVYRHGTTRITGFTIVGSLLMVIVINNGACTKKMLAPLNSDIKFIPILSYILIAFMS